MVHHLVLKKHTWSNIGQDFNENFDCHSVRFATWPFSEKSFISLFLPVSLFLLLLLLLFFFFFIYLAIVSFHIGCSKLNCRIQFETLKRKTSFSCIFNENYENVGHILSLAVCCSVNISLLNGNLSYDIVSFENLLRKSVYTVLQTFVYQVYFHVLLSFFYMRLSFILLSVLCFQRQPFRFLFCCRKKKPKKTNKQKTRGENSDIRNLKAPVKTTSDNRIWFVYVIISFVFNLW